ncbi:MAG: DNA primase [Proteobacteria bacterium]|nr:MAG: DNA primase [Pseudomonadota bacterium]
MGTCNSSFELDSLDSYLAAETLAAERPIGAQILDDVAAFLSRFVAYPSEAARNAHTLWIAHAHAMDAWESTPRIAFLSPEPGSGKTRALEITELLVPNAVEAVNVTPAYLFRKVGDVEMQPTILFDEIDTVFGPKAKDNEEIRGLLNAGHRRGAVAGRCVVKGKTVTTEEIPAYCAVALAGLGDLPDTILTRSICIRMRRRSPEEVVEPYRRRVHEDDGHAIRDRLANWIAGITPNLADAWPTMPEGIQDRDADVWEPLLAIADAAGGEWPSVARCNAVTLVTDAKVATPSLGIKLLTDLKKIFEGYQQLPTDTILERLNNMVESPWGDLKGRPLDSRGLARRLGKYHVKPKLIRIGEYVSRGYTAADLHDPWKRYVGVPTIEAVTSVTALQGELS